MIVEAWHKKHAIQTVASLPENTDDAIIVLDLAMKLVKEFLVSDQPLREDLDRDRGMVISLSSVSKGNNR